MTLHATRAGQAITIHGNTGADIHVEKGQIHHVRVTEHAQHVRHFHDQLGKLLDEADAEREQPERTSEHHRPHEHGE